MSKTYKGIVFDFDGTLVNTIEDLANSVNAALVKMGYPTWEIADYCLKVGHGFRNLVQNAMPEDKRGDEALLDQTVEYFVESYATQYMNKSKPYDGIREMLHTLEEKGIKIAVNSNKRTDYTEHMVATIFPEVPFVGVFGERKDIPKKPDPAGALKLCEMMGLSPEEVLYIGDSSTDMKTGHNAGMDTVGVSWGFRGREELMNNGATYIAETAEDIVRITEG